VQLRLIKGCAHRDPSRGARPLDTTTQVRVAAHRWAFCAPHAGSSTCQGRLPTPPRARLVRTGRPVAPCLLRAARRERCLRRSRAGTLINVCRSRTVRGDRPAAATTPTTTRSAPPTPVQFLSGKSPHTFGVVGQLHQRQQASAPPPGVMYASSAKWITVSPTCGVQGTVAPELVRIDQVVIATSGARRCSPPHSALRICVLIAAGL